MAEAPAVVPIGEAAAHVNAFTCRSEQVTKFVTGNALRWEREDWARTFALMSDGTDPAVPRLLGIYTLCMARVIPTDLPPDVASGLVAPPAALPAAMLAQVARDSRAPARLRLGEFLVGDAIRRVLAVSASVGCAGVVLQAENPELVRYYARFGFVELKRARHMFLALGTARAGLPG